MEDCTTCNGTGYEICDSPDHGFDDVMSYFGGEHAHGCPLCGWDDEHRILSSKCDKCKGSGKTN